MNKSISFGRVRLFTTLLGAFILLILPIHKQVYAQVHEGPFQRSSSAGAPDYSDLRTSELLADNTESVQADASVNNNNASLSIKYYAPKPGFAEVTIFSTAGILVKTLLQETLQSGTAHLNISTSDLSVGAYYWRLKTGGITITRQVQIVK